MAIPKVAAIHDLSGLGKCSLTAAIPILSVCGVQAVPLATAVLSNQTAFESYTGVDLSEYLPMIAAEWKKRKLSLDGIFTGYLSNEQQVEWVGGFIDSFAKDDTLILVDPVLGDEGVYYRGFGEQMRLAMRRLCGKADVITPNLTEAAMLLDQDFPSSPITRAQGKSMLVRLSELGPEKVVITGVKLATGEMANIGYDREKNAFWAVDCDYVPVSYPGTGDIFASVLTGGMLTGDSLPMAMDRASRFVELAIKTTFGYGSDTRYGVMLEMCLPELMSREVPHRYHIF